MTRYIKIFRDITSDLTKNLMLVLAIAIGLFAVGSILGAYAVLTREMAVNYNSTQPASATIKLDNAAIDKKLTDDINKIPGISESERHATITARMKIGNDWFPLLLFVVDDFRNIKLNKFTSISGALAPPEGTMLVERTALEVMKSKEGGSVLIKTPNGRLTPVPITGIVHDAGLAPARQEKTGYGYITLSTLNRLGEQQGFDELKILVNNGERSAEIIEKKSREAVDLLENRGYSVHEVQIPPPGKHPHQSQMNTILFLFTIFSFMTLILSSVLVATSISTLMIKQVREIGIMKTIGSNSFQVSGLYFIMILVLSLTATVIAIPLSKLTAALLIKVISGNLNLTIFDPSIPFWVSLIQLLSGILIPFAAAAFPIIRAGRTTVKQALNNYGVSQNNFGRGHLEKALSKMNVLGDIFTLSLRNIFRHRSRLVMTLVLLAAGGAMFIGALNISKAWDVNLQKIYQYRRYDLEVRFSKPIKTDELITKIKGLTRIKEAEAWNTAPTSFLTDTRYNIVNTYPDKGHGSFIMVGLPAGTDLVKFPVLDGGWLKPGNNNEVVLNHMAHALRPNLKTGDNILLSLDGRSTNWVIAGFVEDIGSPAAAYVSENAFAALTNSSGTSNMLRIAMTERDDNTNRVKTREIIALLEKENAPVSMTIPILELHNAIAEHMSVLVNSLLAMAILMAAVGTLGLMSTMSMNIFERTRELGVMRAIGAAPKVISKLVIMEGLSIGVLSLLFAFIFSAVLSEHLGKLIGYMAFRTPLPFAVSYLAIVLWVVIIIAGSIIATLYPAWRANRITTREALSYE